MYEVTVKKDVCVFLLCLCVYVNVCVHKHRFRVAKSSIYKEKDEGRKDMIASYDQKEKEKVLFGKQSVRRQEEKTIPLASEANMSIETEMAPASCPKIVTAFGSPLKAGISVLTHRKAWI